MAPSSNLLDTFTVMAPDCVDGGWVVGVGVVLLSWLWWAFRRAPARADGRAGFDLFRLRPFPWLFGARVQPQLFRWLLLAGLAGTLVLLLTGPFAAPLNPGAAILWSVWWPAIAVLPWLVGRGFCGVCPLPLLRHGRLGRRTPRSFAALGILPAALVLLLFASLDRLLRIEESPWIAGQFLAVAIVVAVVAHLAFRDRLFCKQICPIGAVQTVLARVSPLRWGRRHETADVPAGVSRSGEQAAPCTYHLNPHHPEPPHECTLCGDCYRGREPDLALHVAPPFGDPLPPRALRGESSVSIVLLALVAFEQLQVTDPWEMVLLLYERGGFPFGTPPIPDVLWSVPVVPGVVASLLLLAACVVFFALLRWLVLGLFVAFGGGLSGEDRGRFGASLAPLVATAFLAFHLPAATFLPELGARVWAVVSGGSWYAVPWFQAAAYPAATLGALRIVLVVGGVLASIFLAWRTARALGPRRGTVVRRLAAEVLYVVLLGAFFLFLYSLPATSGDPC